MGPGRTRMEDRGHWTESHEAEYERRAKASGGGGGGAGMNSSAKRCLKTEKKISD
jgi:hypothetical protein